MKKNIELRIFKLFFIFILIILYFLLIYLNSKRKIIIQIKDIIIHKKFWVGEKCKLSNELPINNITEKIYWKKSNRKIIDLSDGYI